MSTQSWSSRLRHDSDAVFREWGSDLAAKMAAVGLVQTADTGQINWTTVVRAGANADAGYEIWRFNDSLQGTAPIFFRVNYGTGASTTTPRTQIIVGTGSNGSGTITGTALSTARQTSSNTVNGQVVDTARQSYMCAVAGFFGYSFKVGAGQGAESSFFICRTVDSAGVPTVTGSMVHWGGNGNVATARQAFRYAATAVAYTVQTAVDAQALSMNPMAVISTLVGSDIQVMLAWTITPRVAPLIGVCGVLAGELAVGGTFNATLVGTTPRTYMTMSTIFGPMGSIAIGTAGSLSAAMLWE
jgi:hypothetical protein